MPLESPTSYASASVEGKNVRIDINFKIHELSKNWGVPVSIRIFKVTEKRSSRHGPSDHPQSSQR